jgi:hypothetical protein
MWGEHLQSWRNYMSSDALIFRTLNFPANRPKPISDHFQALLENARLLPPFRHSAGASAEKFDEIQLCIGTT